MNSPATSSPLRPLIGASLVGLGVLGAAYLLMLVGRGQSAADKLREGLSQGGIEQPKGERQVPPVQARWPGIKELIAAAPAAELTDHEFEFNKVTYILSAPASTTLEFTSMDARVKAAISPQVVLEFLVGSYDMEERKKTMTKLFSGVAPFPYGDDSTLIVEFVRDTPKKYDAYCNLRVGYQDFHVRIDYPEGSYNQDGTLDQVLLAVKCARSLRRKEPAPENPLAVFQEMKVRMSPQSEDPAKITEIYFPGDATGALFPLLKHFPNVEEISLNYAYLYRPGDYQHLAECTKLKKLRGPENDIPAEAIAQISKCTELESIDPNFRNLSAEDLAPLARLKKLQLVVCSADEESAMHLGVLGKLPELRRLICQIMSESINEIKSPDVTQFLAKLPELRELSLQADITGDHFLPLQQLTQLEVLSLEGAKMADADLKRLAPLTGLKRLSLEGSVFESLNDLKITGLGLADLAPLVNLESLSLEYAPLEDSGIEHLLAFPALAELRFVKANITDAGLARLAELKTLKKLTLSDCPNITEEGKTAFRELRSDVEISRF